MAECNITLPYPTVKPEEKICKYSYASWCPTCERDSPRRRAQSECLEPCRRRGKEMKSLTPKKYDRYGECENMETDIGRDYRLDRMRTNLCELPTTYITNNRQISPNMSSVSEKLSGQEHSERRRLTTPQVRDDYSALHQSMGVKDPAGNGYRSISHLESRTSPKLLPALRASSPPPARKRSVFTRYDNGMDDRERIFNTSDDHYNVLDMREKYCRELEILREKLNDLRNHKYSPIKPPAVIKNLDRYTDNDSSKPTNVNEIKVIENVTSPKIDGKFKFGDIKPTRPKSAIKLTVKSKAKLSNPKILKNRPKPKIVMPADDDDDDESDLDSEKELIEEEKLKFEEEELKSIAVALPPKKESKGALKRAAGSGDGQSWPLRESLFPHIPPYINFNTHDGEPFVLPQGRRYLKWKLSTITPIVVRKTLVNTGFRLVRKSNEWVGTWGKHMKSPMFQTLKNGQKLNHFAGTFQLGRKDRLWKNLQRLMLKHGTKEFGIIPHTYVLPQDLKSLKQNWECKDGSAGEKWIIKPPASARGVGIKVINKWSQLPKQTSLVVQKYISDPYLINGSKFDLRLYVLVTSFNPLRIYLYPEGLVRFASVKYSDSDKDLKDRYMHLTNYSINKLSSQYTANEDANSCQGHKWTLSKLWEYMEGKGIDTKGLWTNLKQLVIKTMISGESPISLLCTENVQSRYNCYELFGVDVLFDQRLKPWLLEVNISPSLHSTSPLDLHVKGPLVQILFNLAQFHLPAKLGRTENGPKCFDPRIYTTTLTAKENAKHSYFLQLEQRVDYLDEILLNLTGDDVRMLTQAEDELVAKGPFERIFPTSTTYKYLDFMNPRYYNRLFDAWEYKYEHRRELGISKLKALCSRKVHLKVAPQSKAIKSSPSTNLGTQSLATPDVPTAQYQGSLDASSAIKTDSATVNCASHK